MERQLTGDFLYRPLQNALPVDYQALMGSVVRQLHNWSVMILLTHGAAPYFEKS